MLIDWVTVGAQAVNFLVLVYLLKRFLYGPILRAMDKREEDIANRILAAKEMQAEAEQSAEENRRKNRELEEQRAKRLAEAEQEAIQHRKALMDEAKQEVDEARHNWTEATHREQQAFLEALKKETVTSILDVSRRILTSLSGDDLAPRVIRTFLEQLAGLEEDEKQRCRAAALEQEAVIRTSFAPDDAVKGRLEEGVRALCGKGARLRFEQAPQMILGIELTLGGLRYAWNVDSHLASLGERLSGPPSPEEPAPEAHGGPEEGPATAAEEPTP